MCSILLKTVCSPHLLCVCSNFGQLIIVKIYFIIISIIKELGKQSEFARDPVKFIE
jgi:hypothetical protein